MNNDEKAEFEYIKDSLKNLGDRWANLTIRTDRSPEYKQALHEFYTGLGFHPADIRVDTKWFDEHERIVYIRGLISNGIHWTKLYSKAELDMFNEALL